MIFEEFANDLYAITSDGRGDTETSKKHIKEYSRLLERA
jgi:hypothetical protein